jgi:hypothetical protein
VILTGSSVDSYSNLQTCHTQVVAAYENLKLKVDAILDYDVTFDSSDTGLEALISDYDSCFDTYRIKLSDYSEVYAIFVNEIRAKLGEANEYIAAIVDDNQLTPSEKKQLLNIYNELAAEYKTNVSAALNARIWKKDSNGNEVAGVYAGPNGEGTSYYDAYISYKNAYSPLLNVFTGTD